MNSYEIGIECSGSYLRIDMAMTTVSHCGDRLLEDIIYAYWVKEVNLIGNTTPIQLWRLSHD